jgi:hypothetical protein
MTACTLGSLEGLSSPPPPGGEADATAEAAAISETSEAGADVDIDAGVDADLDARVDAEVDAGPNLFPLGTFERGGCGGATYLSTLTDDPTAHSGTHACRVCSDGTPPDVYSFDATLDNAPVVGATYHAEVWVRSAPGATAPASGVEINLRTYNNPPFDQIQDDSSGHVPVGTSWTMLSVDLDVTTTAQRLDFFVDSNLQAGTCFLMDDLVVQRVR